MLSESKRKSSQRVLSARIAASSLLLLANLVAAVYMVESEQLWIAFVVLVVDMAYIKLTDARDRRHG